MGTELKFLSLQKPELLYEVEIRGDTPSATVPLLRKQIAKLGPLFPSADILESHLETVEDLDGVEASLARLEEGVNLPATKTDKPKQDRLKNLALQIQFRLNRIDVSSNLEASIRLSQANIKLQTLQSSLAVSRLRDTLEAPLGEVSEVSPSLSSDPLISGDSGTTTSPPIVVSCDRGLSGDLSSLKYSGKTCARAFIQRVKEFTTARNINSSRILKFATEIFTGDALHWFRSLQDTVSSWDEVCERLKEDFSQSDYDYRFLEEIRARTQGERENITIFLSIMAGMFSQLQRPLSEADRLEIILHNIRPIYASVLTSVSKIESIEQLRTLAKNFEDVQARLSQFREPPKAGPTTLAPNFAYAHASDGSHTSRYSENKPSPNHHFQQYKSPPTSAKPVHAVTRQLFCPRCRVDSHSLRQCKAERKIVCFRCGRPDFRHYDCPDCQGSKPKN